MKITAVICLVSVLCTSCINGSHTKKVKLDALEYVDTVYSGDQFHKANTKSYIPVATSGLIKLLFDEKTATIAVHDTSSDKIWSSLPSDDVTKQISSYPVEIVLSNGDNKVYTLNSQNNSVNFGNFVYTLGVNEVNVTYSMSLNKEVGAKNISDVADDEIRADVTITYLLQDGSLYVTVGMNHLALPKDVYLEKISILNNFGAFENSGEDDFILVPDGSGALIMTGKEDKDFSPISLSVYGTDAGVAKNASETQCLLGAFGIKNSDSAFLCTIEEGDTIANIHANRNGDKSLNSVYASFNTTDIYTQQNKNNITKYYGEEYKNEIKLCYRFLSGKLASYSGMATACRENLIRNSVLPARTNEITGDHIPMVIALEGGYVNQDGKYITLTDYEQALSLTTLLKAKGIDSAYVRYNGLHTNANNGTIKNFDDFKNKLGKNSEYNDFYNYISSQKYSLFIDTDILTYKSSFTNAKAIDGKALKSDPINSFPYTTKTQSFLPLSRLEDKIDDMLTESEKINFDGYSLNDIGKYLYSDYSSNFYSRTQAQKEISSQIPVLAASKLLMIDTGNFYAIKNANVVSNIPVSPLAYKESSAYVGIPFVQMILHGIMEYSISPINVASDMKTAFLKSIEYGCLPSVQWYCSEYDETLDKTYHFNSNINEIVAFYTQSDEALKELRNSRITSHTIVQNGVYCTEYDNSVKVYINYNDHEVTINGVIVNAKDCVTIS